MITGRAMGPNGPVLLIGLSRTNCTRLLDDQPIEITRDTLEAMGLPADMNIVLIAGETEATISEQLGGMPLQPEVAGQRFIQRSTGRVPKGEQNDD